MAVPTSTAAVGTNATAVAAPTSGPATTSLTTSASTPTAVNTTASMAAGAATAKWSVEEGQCKVDGMGCVMSPNFPQPYGADQACRVSAKERGPISVVSFETELYFDTLLVDGKAFSGFRGPAGVTPGGPLQWSSDVDTEASGWKLCLFGEGGAPPYWNVDGGPCSVDAWGCAVSPNFPKDYSIDQQCNLTLGGTPGPIYATSFSTEFGFDRLVVNGVPYSSTWGPDGITPLGTVTWTSDYDEVSKGWQLCLEPPETTTTAAWVAPATTTAAWVAPQASPRQPAPATGATARADEGDEGGGGFSWVWVLALAVPVLSLGLCSWYRKKQLVPAQTGQYKGTSLGRRYTHFDDL